MAKLSLAFDIVPEDRSHLDLKTGEIFQNRRYARLRRQEDKQISAKLFVTRKEHNTAGAELPSMMRYRPAIEEWGASIDMVWRLVDDRLASLHSIILTGKMPSGAVVSFPLHNELEYGWEPDGSGQTWDNENSPSIPIEDVRLDFSLQASRPSETDLPEGYDAEFFADAARVRFVLIRKLASIEFWLARISWTVGLIAVLLLVLVLSRYWHW